MFLFNSFTGNENIKNINQDPDVNFFQGGVSSSLDTDIISQKGFRNKFKMYITNFFLCFASKY